MQKIQYQLEPQEMHFFVHASVILGYVVSKKVSYHIQKQIWLLSICLPQK
jgi:hypothetical protein